MAMDPKCPCTRDCPDRPNCKGCERFAVYRRERIKQLEENHAKRSIDRYEMDRTRRKYDTAAKNSKKPKRRIHR